MHDKSSNQFFRSPNVVLKDGEQAMCYLHTIPFILQVIMSWTNKGKGLSSHLPTGHFINLYLRLVGAIGHWKPNCKFKIVSAAHPDRIYGSYMNTDGIHTEPAHRHVWVHPVSLDCKTDIYGNCEWLILFWMAFKPQWELLLSASLIYSHD